MRVAVMVVCLLLAACSGGGDDDAIAAGDCLDGPTLSEATEAPCDEGHAFEVVGTPALDADAGAALPDDQTLARDALSACARAFGDHTGTPYAEADYDVTFVPPAPDAWDDGEREVLCAATSLDGTPLEGSIADG